MKIIRWKQFARRLLLTLILSPGYMVFGQSQRPVNYPADGTWPITIKFQKTDHVNGSCSSEIIEHEFSSSAQYSIQYTQPLYWRLFERLADGSSITVTFYNRNNQFLVRRNRIDVAISAAPNASCPSRTNSGTEHYNSVNNPDFPRSNTPSVFDLTTMSLNRAFSGISCSCFPSTLSVATPPLSCTATSEKPQCGEVNSGVVEVKVQGGNKSQPYNYSWNGGSANGGTAQSITGLSSGNYAVSVSQGNNSAQCSVEVVKVQKPQLFWPGSEMRISNSVVYQPGKKGVIFCLFKDNAIDRFISLPEQAELLWYVYGTSLQNGVRVNEEKLLDGLYSKSSNNPDLPFYLSEDPRTGTNNKFDPNK